MYYVGSWIGIYIRIQGLKRYKYAYSQLPGVDCRAESTQRAKSSWKKISHAKCIGEIQNNPAIPSVR